MAISKNKRNKLYGEVYKSLSMWNDVKINRDSLYHQYPNTNHGLFITPTVDRSLKDIEGKILEYFSLLGYKLYSDKIFGGLPYYSDGKGNYILFQVRSHFNCQEFLEVSCHNY